MDGLRKSAVSLNFTLGNDNHFGVGLNLARTKQEIKMNFTIEQEQESDGRWLAEVPELSGVLAYGATSLEAMSKVEVLALRVIADRLEHNEAATLP